MEWQHQSKNWTKGRLQKSAKHGKWSKLDQRQYGYFCWNGKLVFIPYFYFYLHIWHFKGTVATWHLILGFTAVRKATNL